MYNAPFYTNDDLQQMRLAYYAITYLCLFTRLFLSISREGRYTAPLAALADCPDMSVSIYLCTMLHFTRMTIYSECALLTMLLHICPYSPAFFCPLYANGDIQRLLLRLRTVLK